MYIYGRIMTQNANPLSQYFRQPAIYVRLPSGGRFWPQDAVNMPANGELAVYPMTAVDEITSRTPDALFNGSAVVRIIESCVPDIKDAWSMPNVDIDTLLVSTRIATYGHEMEITTQCTECNTDQDYGLDLRTVLENISTPDYSKPLTLGDLQIYFKPISYRELNENSQVQFQDQKLIQVLQDTEMDEAVKLNEIGKAMVKITELTVNSIAQSIATIRTPSAQVHEPEHIREFIMNCDKSVFNAVRDHAISIKQSAEVKPLKMKCSHCSADYTQPFTLDMSNFFAVGS